MSSGRLCKPYLEYHHFDPTWHERGHHEPAGMIALCAEHHRKADSGAFTQGQLAALKRATGSVVTGRFDWLRHRLLAVVGGNFYYETPTIIQFQRQPQIWYTRNQDGYLQLSLRMISAGHEPRLQMDENDRIVRGAPTDFESPPSGRRIFARYTNGDELSIEFFEINSAADAAARYPSASPADWSGRISFPVTAVQIQNLIGGKLLGFGPTRSTLGGNQLGGNFVANCPVGLSWS